MRRFDMPLGKFSRWNEVCVLILSLCSWNIVCPCVAAQDKADLQAVIENVRACEALYANLDVEVESHYETQEDTTGISDGITSRRGILRSVTQGQYIYVSLGENADLADSTRKDVVDVLGFDGATTRVLNGNVGNIVKGSVRSCNTFRPHTWLIARAHVCFPLSVWLEGGKGLRNREDAGFYAKLIHKVKVVGFERVAGANAVKVRIEDWDDIKVPTLNTVREVWLDTAKNYLPMRTVGYIPRLSEKLPVEVSTAWDFRELEPGVWLPFRTRIVCYDQPSLLYKSKAVVGNVEELRMEKADLHPRYEVAFFRNVPFPSGTLVYEMENGQIVEAYVTGLRGKLETAYRRHKSLAWLLAISLVFATLLALAYLWRYRRMDNSQDDPGLAVTRAPDRQIAGERQLTPSAENSARRSDEKRQALDDTGQVASR
jgi:hypothetical protein